MMESLLSRDSYLHILIIRAPKELGAYDRIVKTFRGDGSDNCSSPHNILNTRHNISVNLVRVGTM